MNMNPVERKLIGGLLLKDHRVMEVCAALQPEDFTQPIFRELFKACLNEFKVEDFEWSDLDSDYVEETCSKRSEGDEAWGEDKVLSRIISEEDQWDDEELASLFPNDEHADDIKKMRDINYESMPTNVQDLKKSKRTINPFLQHHSINAMMPFRSRRRIHGQGIPTTEEAPFSRFLA